MSGAGHSVQYKKELFKSMNKETVRPRLEDIWKISRSRRDAPYLEQLRSVTYAPVFVMGENRSGTTILCKLLALSGSFNYLTTYHTLYYEQLLANNANGSAVRARKKLDAFLRSAGITSRLVDEIEADVDYSEEYNVILWTRSRSLRLHRRNFRIFDEMCRKLQHTGDLGRKLLLRNPSDFDNFLTIKRLVPGAKFVFVHRYPLNTLNSLMRMLRRNWYKGNIFNQLHSRTYTRLQYNPVFTALIQWLLSPDSRVQVGRRLLTRRIARRSNYYIQHIGELSDGDYISLRYEDLCKDPRGQMERIFHFLGVTPRHEPDYERLIRPRRLSLLPELERIETSLQQRFQIVITYHGYDTGTRGWDH